MESILSKKLFMDVGNLVEGGIIVKEKKRAKK